MVWWGITCGLHIYCAAAASYRYVPSSLIYNKRDHRAWTEQFKEIGSNN